MILMLLMFSALVVSVMYYGNSSAPAEPSIRHQFQPSPSPPVAPPIFLVPPPPEAKSLRPTFEEYAALLPKLLDPTHNSTSIGCPVYSKDKSGGSWPFPTVPVCEVNNLAAVSGNFVFWNCSAKAVTYTFNDHHLIGPMTYPSYKGAPRQFMQATTSPIYWPPKEKYIELQCGDVRRIFHRLVPIPGLLDQKLAAIQAAQPHIPADAPNLIMIILDSVSRPQAIKLLPKTMSLFQSVNHGITHRYFTFNRLNSPDHRKTLTNLTPLFAGVMWDYNQDHMRHETHTFSMDYTDIYTRGSIQPQFLWDVLQRNGYVTLMGALNNNLFGTRYWNSTFDHFVPAISDWWGGDRAAHLSKLIYGYDPEKGPCFAGEPTYKILFDQTRELLHPRTYPGARKFAFLHILEAHRNPAYAFHSADNDLHDFILHLMGIPNTVIYFGSDHGPGGWERRTPFLHLLLPRESLQPEAERNLFDNQLKLVSHFDMHETLRHIIVGQKPKSAKALRKVFGESVSPPNTQSLLSPLPVRDCNQANIFLRSCMCTVVTPVPRKSEFATEFLNAAFAFIHANIKSPCKKLSLHSYDSLIESSLPGNNETYLTGAFTAKQHNARFRFEAAYSRSTKSFSEFSVSMLTTYSVYERCRPSSVNPNFCVCS